MLDEQVLAMEAGLCPCLLAAKTPRGNLCVNKGANQNRASGWGGTLLSGKTPSESAWDSGASCVCAHLCV